MSREQVFKTIAWITARHLMHYQAIMQLLASVGARFMQVTAPDIYVHAASTMQQNAELHELKALQAAYEMKRLARHAGGWQDHHGIGLDQIADVLVMEHDWELEEVGTFVEELTEGHFVIAHSGDDDEND